MLRWHIQDPVSEKEILRNQVIYTYQENRNPFIDKPELVEMIWGTSADYQLGNEASNTYYKSFISYNVRKDWEENFYLTIDIRANKELFM